MYELDKYLSDETDTNLLRRFAFLGNSETLKGKLNFLARIAEPEDWDQVDCITNRQNSTLFYYVIHTFDRCYKQQKIVVKDDNLCALFNTGLMNEQGHEIYCLFEKSNSYKPEVDYSNYWYMSRFILSNSREFLQLGIKKPELASYFEDYNELYFNPDLNIEVNFDHMYDDNLERLPIELKSIPKESAIHIFNGFLEFTLKKIRRNNRIPVPQFYRDKVMFLIPVKVFGTKVMVIALERIGETYIGNTVLTMEMAYNCARLLNRPESDWLIVKEKITLQ